MSNKNSPRKVIGKILQFPGALLALILYSILAVVGIANGARNQPVKDFFMRAIPGAGIVFWLALAIWLWSIWN